jgi:hypothetical protein
VWARDIDDEEELTEILDLVKQTWREERPKVAAEKAAAEKAATEKAAAAQAAAE